MTDVVPAITLSPRDYDAVLFDLDGVLTRSASVHAAAWKKLFDAFLEQHATQEGTPFVPFDIATDYPRHVDGKPAPDAFLEAARQLGVEPARAVVVEDAIVGVEAGRAGRFGCVIGVDRHPHTQTHAQALSDAGADVVVPLAGATRSAA